MLFLFSYSVERDDDEEPEPKVIVDKIYYIKKTRVCF